MKIRVVDNSFGPTLYIKKWSKVQNLCNSIMIYKNLEFQNSLKFEMGFKMHFTVFLVEGFRATLKVVWSSL